MFTDIDSALDYLYSFIDYETCVNHVYDRMNYNIRRTSHLLNLLGNPQNSLKFFHVAGTKGKGTVCYLLENFLINKGYSPGLFISPHIEKINERISFCGQNISDNEIIELLNTMKPFIDKLPKGDKPTTFEILTAMAVYFFKEKNADYVILETGMGGRLDSTNFCQPVISVITSISFDHMDKLGHTMEKIAYEKAGIIKTGSPVVLSYQQYGVVVEICRRLSKKLKSDFFYVPEYFSYEIKKQNEMGTIFHIKRESKVLNDVLLRIPGRHQINNGLTSIMALEAGGIKITEKDIRDVFFNIHLPARVELMKIGGKRFILDSAHNESSAKSLINTVKEHFNYKKLVSVIGVVGGKDTFGILSNLIPASNVVVVTNPVTHKPTDPRKVWNVSLMFRKDVLFIPNLEEAIKLALDIVENDDIAIITGSFYTVAPSIEILRKINNTMINNIF